MHLHKWWGSSESIDLEVINKFYWLGKFTRTEFMNNKDRQYVCMYAYVYILSSLKDSCSLIFFEISRVYIYFSMNFSINCARFPSDTINLINPSFVRFSCYFSPWHFIIILKLLLKAYEPSCIDLMSSNCFQIFHFLVFLS